MSSVLEQLEKHDFTFSGRRMDKPSLYLMKKARKSPQGLEDLEKSLKSSTVYVGNLSFYTTEEQIYELFDKCGEISQIIMGLDRFKKTPCGFCFVVYESRKSALECVKFLSGCKLDNKFLEIDVDPGFEEGRQFGRGKSGGQIKNEYNNGSYGRMYNNFVPFHNGNTDFNNYRQGERRDRGEFTDTYIPPKAN